MRQIDCLTSVIDNFGDAGFALNLAISLLYHDRNIHINFFCDDKELFLKLKGNIETPNLVYYDVKDFEKHIPAETIYNFFDRKINFEYLHTFAHTIELINFSYFLMHDGVKNLHNVQYQSKNVKVTHYIPSLLPEGGGIIISPYGENFSQLLFEKGSLYYKKYFFPNLSQEIYDKPWISVFCYKETFEQIKEALLQDTQKIYLVFQYDIQGKNIINMPFLNILDYEKILYVCDGNIVRGENSLISAILSKKPFLWDIYKEHNDAHIEKIEDFIVFLKTFSQNNDYFEDFRAFNLSEDKAKVLKHIFSLHEKNMFHQLSAYTYQNAHLLRKLKK